MTESPAAWRHKWGVCFFISKFLSFPEPSPGLIRQNSTSSRHTSSELIDEWPDTHLADCEYHETPIDRLALSHQAISGTPGKTPKLKLG